jgi:glucokinase
VTSKQDDVVLHNPPLVVGVDVGGTQLRVAVLRGKTLLSRIGLLIEVDSAPSALIPRMTQAIHQALREAKTSLDQIAGIGVGIPGPVNGDTGVVYEITNIPGWNDVPLRNILAQKFGNATPVFVENDANVAGLGEYVFGAGRGYSHIVYLTVSTGIGACVIVDGKILRGVSGTAGELGHIIIDWEGDPCNCGNIGCLESIASGIAIARRAKEAIQKGEALDLLDFVHNLPDRQNHSEEESILLSIDAEMVAKAASEGVPSACEMINRAATGLGVGLVSILHAFNTERIILGGGLTQTWDLLIEPAIQIAQKRTMKAARKAMHIVPAQLGADTGLIGAGALVYHDANKVLQPVILSSIPEVPL